MGQILWVFVKTGLERKKLHKIYSVQFKVDVLQYTFETDESYLGVAVNFGIPGSSIIANWMRIWNKEGVNGLSKPKGRPTMSKRKAT